MITGTAKLQTYLVLVEIHVLSHTIPDSCVLPLLICILIIIGADLTPNQRLHKLHQNQRGDAGPGRSLAHFVGILRLPC